MLDPSVIQKSIELAATGRSARSIAKELGVSRASLTLILNGRRVIQEKPVEEFAIPDRKTLAPTSRCSRCGFIVQLPCVACNTHDYLEHKAAQMAEKVKKKDTAEPVLRCDTIQIELTGVHWERYEKIRRWRAMCRNPHFMDIPENWPWRETVR